ncbi:hypothetical protein BZA05DRAFT_384648 [Tricharina praecox]|uniref:uncharacterized protein n=1 Tax=Tricharina praecox TaxID=43433 RepID=UPI00221FAE8F|nr:uncharacterized protein BZA05DRAFT_384648 [Tricharina praecox]KAI5857736.1 hypothetical protein BZA05DRAFT_384648 [Tricharina praecox]
MTTRTSSKRPLVADPASPPDSKRYKPANLPADFFAASSATAPGAPHAASTTTNTTTPEETGLDAEWARFEAEVVAEPELGAAIPSHAVISAAPVAATGKAKEEKPMVEEDVEDGEDEEAQERLLEEFEEMEGLEERVRKLKERREALRKVGEREGGGIRLEMGRERPRADEGESSGEESDDEEEEEFFLRGR